MSRKICVVTGSRAEYGLLRWVMEGIRDDSDLTLQIISTGMHLSPEFGLTYRSIENDGFRIDRCVEMLVSSSTNVGVAKSMGLGLIGFADALSELKPDLMLVLGDRFEIFSAVTAALVGRIPVAHVHGGEVTEGAFDDALRHAITKMSHLHFVAAESYRQRVMQLGEQPEHVFLVGGLGVDGIKRLKLLSREELEASLAFSLGAKSLMVTFHPATLEAVSASHQVSELLAVLSALRDTQLIFTLPNADTDSGEIRNAINEFVMKHPNARAYTSLGQLRYLSCLSHVDGVIGNSSSGLTEAPTFRKGTINIGDRQNGRLRSASVIDCEPRRGSISSALEKLYSKDFQGGLPKCVNPYGTGGASAKIVRALKGANLAGMVKKKFFDFPPSHAV